VNDDTLLRVALTFDAEHPDRPWCPPRNAEHILATLGEAGVRATFFVQGRWAESQPDTAKRIVDEGHLVGNHSHYHARMPLLHDDGVQSDVLDAQAVIERVTGKDPRPWFRCPFGAGADDGRVLGVLQTLGYRNIGWHVELEDWEATRTGSVIAHDAIEGVREHGDGAVILLHTWPGGTGEGIGPMIAGLRDIGASFVSIDELDDLP
jgi:peptidoglycan/xylan/chitin deacetylase (PgdA/CDA1 family)